MPIHIRTWLGRLTVEVPGWYFWHAPHPNPDRPWHAVPAAAGVRVARPYELPSRIDAATPQELRERCRQRLNAALDALGGTAG